MIVLCAPRRWAILGVFVSVCYITQGQTLNVGGFNFFAQRIVLLAGFIRIMARGELKSLKSNKMDWALLAYVILSTITVGIRTGVWKETVGTAYNILLTYFVFRSLITSWEDLQELLPKLAILIVPLALCMVYESRTGINVFNAMGGQGAEWSREGRFRCIGSFRGPHTAGIFGATLVPLFAYMYFRPDRRDQRGIAIIGLIAATAITYASNSSGPLMAYLCGLVGLAFWPLRKDMKRVRWGILVTFIAYALLSKAPVWYIFSKISDITGGDGWSRSYLMDQCFNHMSRWWLLGTDNTGDWASTQMPWGGADLCNIFVSCAAEAGMGGLILMILLMVWGFQYLGWALQKARETQPQSEGLFWTLGCVLFAHINALLEVTYFDQLFVVWWGVLAIISSISSNLLEQAPSIQPAEEVDSLVPVEAFPQPGG